MCNVGDLIEGRYRVERSVGSGGMGIVYQATDLLTNGSVAVKVLSASVEPSVAARARLQREIELLSRLHSHHIAAFLSAGCLEDGLPYFVMEFLEGRDLKAELRRRGPLPFDEAAAYLVHACRGIAVAHRLGIVHRDLKPQNLFLTGLDGVRTLKVVDFGVAKCLDACDPGITATDMAVGTPLYMSPEQLLDSRAISTRSDVWALGVILYELLAGFSPFSDDSPGAVIAAVTLDDPVPIQTVRPDVPDGLAKAIAAALVKQPRERIGTAEELEQLLMNQATPDQQLMVVEGAELQAQTANVRPPRVRVSGYLRDQILSALDAGAPQERVTLRCLPTVSTRGSNPLPERLSLVPALQSLTPGLPELIGKATAGHSANPQAAPVSRVRAAARTALAFIGFAAAVSAGAFAYGQYLRLGAGADFAPAPVQSRSSASLATADSPRCDVVTPEEPGANAVLAASEPLAEPKAVSISEPEAPFNRARSTSRGVSVVAPAAPVSVVPVQPRAAKIVPKHL
jgi:serine/threonine-protein kinase